MSRKETVQQAVTLLDKGFTCSQSILLSFADYYDLDEQLARLISYAFCGGIGRLRQKCSALTGGLMVLGLLYSNNNLENMDFKLNATKKICKLSKQVENIYGTTNCVELLPKYAITKQRNTNQCQKIICRKVVGEVTGLVYDVIMLNSESNLKIV